MTYRYPFAIKIIWYKPFLSVCFTDLSGLSGRQSFSPIWPFDWRRSRTLPKRKKFFFRLPRRNPRLEISSPRCAQLAPLPLVCRCNSLQIKKDRKDWDDTLTYNVKCVLTIGDKRLSLQLINAIELPDQICLLLVCMNPQTPLEHSWASASRKIASISFLY